MGIFNTERVLTPSWDLVKPSIELVKNNFWQIIYLSFIPGLLLFMGLTLLGEDPRQTPATQLGIGVLIAFTGGIWAMIVYPGYLYMQVKALEGKDISAWESIKFGLPRLPAVIAMSFVGAVLIILGFFALIVPGLLLIRGFVLAPYYVVDQKLGPIEALKKSYRDSVPVSGWIWGLIGVQIVIGIVASALGRLPFIGFLLSLGLSYLYVFAPAIRYAEITRNFKPKTETHPS